MPAHWLVRQGYPLRLFMERPRHVSRFLTRSFESDGPLGQQRLFISRRATPAEAAGSILRAARILKAGLIVNLACDVRWAGPHTTPAAFLGRSYTFSSTWVALATMSGAPVVPVFCRMEPAGSFRLEFLAPYHIPADAAEPPQPSRWVQQALDVIADHVRRDPTNSNDYFFWPESTPGQAA
jgi:KDO2-lipid IV(A) lauroyltransferase